MSPSMRYVRKKLEAELTAAGEDYPFSDAVAEKMVVSYLRRLERALDTNLGTLPAAVVTAYNAIKADWKWDALD